MGAVQVDKVATSLQTGLGADALKVAVVELIRVPVALLSGETSACCSFVIL